MITNKLFIRTLVEIERGIYSYFMSFFIFIFVDLNSDGCIELLMIG